MGTLTLGVSSVDLSDDMDWPDEFSWQKVVMQKTFSVTGALLIESNTQKTGRTITLVGSETYGWMRRDDLEVVRDFAEQPDEAMELVFRGQTFNVMFDHENGALEVAPIVDYNSPDASDYFAVTMRFIEVPV